MRHCGGNLQLVAGEAAQRGEGCSFAAKRAYGGLGTTSQLQSVVIDFRRAQQRVR